MRLINVFLGLSAMAAAICWAYEERPGSDDHRDQDRRFNECQKETGCSTHERQVDRPAWNHERGEDSFHSESSDEIGTWCRPEV